MNPSLHHTIRKKSNFTMEENQFHNGKIQFQRRTNLIFKSEQIQFQIRTNSILNQNKSHFTHEEIQLHTLKKVSLNNGTNPISQWNKSNFLL